jgi:hypothetical protein
MNLKIIKNALTSRVSTIEKCIKDWEEDSHSSEDSTQEDVHE